MEKHGQYVKQPWKEIILDTFSKEHTDPSSLPWTIMWLRDLEVSSRPLLQKICEQSTRKTDDQAQEPNCIDPNCISWWREWGRESREGTRDVGYICVDCSLINIGKVEVRGVLWILSKFLNGNCNQRRNSSGE